MDLRLLILGDANSGKTTLIDQLKILYKETPFTKEELDEIKQEIR